ncbi:MAG: SDR family NAD(P)-dependent oxidoreductase, partial [Cyanobacteria bacterium J06626_18]
AEIIATPSPGKWDVLRAIGVEHIFNSRTLDFANEVMALTQGEGVDVVLNSLAGEFRQKSIEVLRQDDAGPCGRFVELGLNDLSAPSPENYFPVSLPALCQEQPELVQSMLQDLMAQFQSGTLRPLPQTVFPFTEVAQAFRTMQRAQHVGKLVVMQDREQGIGNREQESIQSSKFKVQNSSIRLPSHPSAQLRFHPNATYLITGGTGGLGLQVADWMIGCGARHLVLVSRRNPTAEVQEQIRGLTSQGVTVETVQADVSDRQALTSVLYRIAASPYPLRGIVHAAGVLCDGQLEQLSWAQFELVLVPKVQGAWNLHQLTRDLPLDCFVLFSSAASLLGTPGQANHAAANAFLDALARYRQAQGLPGLSLNWGAWSEVGSALQYQRSNALTGLAGVGLIAPEVGLQQLEQLWTQPAAQIGVVPIQWTAFLRQGNLQQSPFLEAFHQTCDEGKRERQAAFQQQLAATPKDRQRALLETHVCSLISQILGFAPEALDRRKGFFDLGLDSLTAMELKNSLQASLGCSLPSTLAFDYPTVDRLLDYLAEQLLTDDTPQPSGLETSELAIQELSDEADLAAQLDQKLADLEDLID